MELNEQELEQVISYPNYDIATDKAFENESLYRKDSIERLKEAKKRLQGLDSELTEEELEQVTAGIPRM